MKNTKKTIALLTSAMLGIATMSVPACAAETADIAGEWYGNIYGMPFQLTLSEDGSYTVVQEDETAEKGTWELKEDDGIVAMTPEDEDIDPETLTIDGDSLILSEDGTEIVFTQDPENAKGFVPAEAKTDVKLEDFNGIWNTSKLSAFGMTAEPSMMGIGYLYLDIQDGKITVHTDTPLFADMTGSEMDVEGALQEDGSLTFETKANLEEEEVLEDAAEEIGLEKEEEETEPNETEKVVIRMLEDGTLSMDICMYASDDETEAEYMVCYMDASTQEDVDAVVEAAKTAAEEYDFEVEEADTEDIDAGEESFSISVDEEAAEDDVENAEEE